MTIHSNDLPQTGRKVSSVVPSILFILFGAAWLTISLIFLKSANKTIERLNRCTSSVTATAEEVKEIQEWEDDDDGGYYETKYIVSYTFEANGKTYNDEYKTSNKVNNGTNFNVVYNSDNPEEHFTAWEKNDIPSVKIVLYVFLAIGIAVIISGTVLLLKTILRRR